MEWAYIFNTFGRRGYGQFYLDFMNAVDPSFLTDPSNPFVLAMLGARGKSLAADVVFHSALNHLNPMDIIEGEEVRHMYLESKPKDAIHRPLYDHGRMIGADEIEADISLMFVNQPIPEILDSRYYSRSIEDREAVIAQCLRNAFEVGKRGDVGGLIFASGYATFDNSHVTISMDGGAHNNWEAEHTVYINSESLMRSQRFQQSGQNLISKYDARGILEKRM